MDHPKDHSLFGLGLPGYMSCLLKRSEEVTYGKNLKWVSWKPCGFTDLKNDDLISGPFLLELQDFRVNNISLVRDNPIYWNRSANKDSTASLHDMHGESEKNN